MQRRKPVSCPWSLSPAGDMRTARRLYRRHDRARRPAAGSEATEAAAAACGCRPRRATSSRSGTPRRPIPTSKRSSKGIEAFEKDTGITVEKQIGPDWNQDSQNQRMEALAAKGFNAFSVYPADASGANGLYEELTPARHPHRQLRHLDRPADDGLLCRRHRRQGRRHGRHRRADQGDGRQGQHHQRARSARRPQHGAAQAGHRGSRRQVPRCEDHPGSGRHDERRTGHCRRSAMRCRPTSTRWTASSPPATRPASPSPRY